MLCYDSQEFISELHCCSLLQLLLLQNIFEQLVLSGLTVNILSSSTDGDCEREDSSSVAPSLGSKDGHDPSLQVHIGIATEGNGLQVTGQNISEDTEATRFFRISGVQAGVK